jgi:hypothetical protein
VLSKAGRTIITSAAGDEVSYMGPYEDDDIRSGEFFLERGDTVTEAFTRATDKTEVFTRRNSASAQRLRQPRGDNGCDRGRIPHIRCRRYHI